MPTTLRICAGAALVVSLLFAGNARADDDLSLDLSKQGYELLLQDKCDKAIELFQKSYALDPQPRTLVNLARCEDKLGKLSSALAHLQEARERATSRKLDAMVGPIDTMIADIEKRTPHLELQLAANAPPGTTIKRGDTVVPIGPLVVDPGVQTFVASAANRADATFTVTLGAGETKTLVLMPGAAIVTAPPVLIEPPAEKPRRSSPIRTVGVATMIVGGAGLVAGGIFGAIAMGKKSDAEGAGCNGAVCPNQAAADTREDAKSAGTISTIAFVAGGVLAAGGLGMFLLAPSASSDRVGLTLSGRF